jgi:hypothetical protein
MKKLWERITREPIWAFLIFLALVKLILPFFLQNPVYQPHRDEFLYLAEGNHPDWGYLEIPPLLNVFAWITIHFGGSLFWIKIWPSLFSSLGFLLCGHMVIRLGGKSFALFLVWLPFIFGAYIRLFFLFQPNFLEVFFWISLGYCLFFYIQTRKNFWLYLLGIALGFGLLSKYSIAFYWTGLLFGILLSPERKIFLNRHFYFGMVLAAILFLPNFLWEYYHNFPFIHHMKELQNQQLQYLNTGDFIKNQFLMNISCLLIWIFGLIFLGFNSRTRQYRVYFWAYLFILFILILLKGKDYYALGAYPILFVFGAFYLENLLQGKWIWLRYVLGLQILILGFLILPILIPVFGPEQLADYYSKKGLAKAGFCKWEDGNDHPLPQDFADMLGWREMTEKANGVYQGLSMDQKKETLVFCDDYSTAGALNFYGKKLNMPEVYSDASNFLLWIPDNFNFQNLILVRKSGRKPDDDINQAFERIRVMDSIQIPLARENGMKILLLEKVKPEFLQYLRKRLESKKAQFIRQ